MKKMTRMREFPDLIELPYSIFPEHKSDCVLLWCVDDNYDRTNNAHHIAQNPKLV